MMLLKGLIIQFIKQDLSTPKLPLQREYNQILLTSEIKQLLLIKRKLRKTLQNSRDPNYKHVFNKSVKYFKT